MAERRGRLPPFVDVIPVVLGKVAEGLVDALASAVLRLVADLPLLAGLSDREKRAVAYAIVGDLLVSPIPEPLDAPLDVVVQERLRALLPEMDRYRRMFMKAAEAMPYLEALPNYLISVLAAIREREVSGRG